MRNTLLNPQDGISQVIVRGKRLANDYMGALVDASVSLSTEQASQIEMTFADPGLRLLNSDLMVLDATIDFTDLNYKIATIGTEEIDAGNEGLKVTGRPESIRKLKGRTGKKVMKRASPSQFVISECKALKIPYVVQSTSRRKSVSRDIKKGGEKVMPEDAPSSWTTFQRLAGEVKMICFEVNGTIYFGKPSWLLRRGINSPVLVNYKTGAEIYRIDRVPVCNQSRDGNGEQTATLYLPLSRWAECRPGRALKLAGMGRFDGYYLIRNVEFDPTGMDPWIELTCSTAIDEGKIFKQPSGKLPSKRASSIATSALRQAGKGYLEGVEVAAPKTKLDKGETRSTADFDNSELVEWACESNGVACPDGYNNIRRWLLVTNRKAMKIDVKEALRKRGCLLFDDKNKRIAITLGNGKIVEAVDRTYGVSVFSTSKGQWSSASKIKGAVY